MCHRTARWNDIQGTSKASAGTTTSNKGGVLEKGTIGAMEAVEGIIIHAVQWLRLAVETIGAFVIALGVVIAIYHFTRTYALSKPNDYVEVRQILVRYLALALEFQLGADILSTAVTPSWDQIGKLGAVATIRTGLNYFLMREMKEERVGAPIAGQALMPSGIRNNERNKMDAGSVGTTPHSPP